MQRYYFDYNSWEDYKNGFYKTPNNKEHDVEIVRNFFNDIAKTEKFMFMVVKEWNYSSLQNLSNKSMNRIAWLGQAAVCKCLGISSLSTMYAWKFIDIDVRNLADNKAIKTIKLWERKIIFENMLSVGLIKVTPQEYQMKLLLN